MASPAASAASSASVAPASAPGAPMSSEAFASAFVRSKHVQFVLSLDKQTDTFEYYVGEHLRMSGVYWGLMAMDLMQSLDSMPLPAIVEWVLQCQDASGGGGFAGNVGHDPHLLYTLSALQILALCDALDRIDREQVANYIAKLQQDDGSFVGDAWGEVDTRFTYCALNALQLIGHAGKINMDKAVEFEVDSGLVGWWLAERQLPTGGLNGRPEKKQDVCYSWWVLSALAILGHTSWIDASALGTFILDCQDPGAGGISDRPGNMADVFHTYFGIAGLALLGYPDLNQIDPIYALPTRIVHKLNLPNRYVATNNNTDNKATTTAAP